MQWIISLLMRVDGNQMQSTNLDVLDWVSPVQLVPVCVKNVLTGK